jgi:deoxyribonuclease-4
VSKLNTLLFGTAGTPLSSEARSSASGIKRIKELRLGCMEVEFVRGVKMGKKTALSVKEVAGNLGIALSVHAPYYINLNSQDREKLEASVGRIKISAEIGAIFKAKSVVFHPAFYMKSSKTAVYNRVKSALQRILEELGDKGLNTVLRPETTGKRTQFGSLDEILKLSSELEKVLPCVDFSHLHARTSLNNTKEEFNAVLSKIEATLGRAGLNNMHIHISGIEYTRKGEKNHLNLSESDLNYLELLRVWKDFNINGLVICESPNLEGDALLLKKSYEGLGVN